MLFFRHRLIGAWGYLDLFWLELLKVQFALVFIIVKIYRLGLHELLPIGQPLHGFVMFT